MYFWIFVFFILFGTGY